MSIVSSAESGKKGDVQSFERIQQIDYSNAKKGRLIAASLAAAIGGFILGSGLGWTSPVQPQLQQLDGSFVSVTDPDSVWYIDLSDNEMSWVGAVWNLGAMVGALSGGTLMDRFGRKVILIAVSLPAAMGWLLVTAAVDPIMLYIGRFLIGFTSGVCSVTSPTYVGEIATPSMRGPLGVFFPVMLAFGVLTGSLLGLGLDWRWISAALGVAPFLLLVTMISLPETPYYMLKKGSREGATKALAWFRGPDYNLGPEMSEMQTRLEFELAQPSSFADLFKPWAIKPVMVAVALMFFQQFSGINAALFNAVRIFDSAHSTLDPLVSAVLLNVDQLVVTFLSAFLVERFGRRTLFLISMAVMGLSMFALGAFFYIQDNYEDPSIAESLGWLPLTSLVVFIAGFGLGAAPIPWVMFSEILPAKVKGPGSSAAATTAWLVAFIITLTFVDMQLSITPAGSFWLFGGFCMLGVLFSIFILPETKGKTPEQIQAYFGLNPSL